MPTMSAWEALCATTSMMLRDACAATHPGGTLRIDDRSNDMLAEEDDPYVVPFYPIGRIYRFDLMERRARHLFGWKRLPYFRWKRVVSFGMEEMWNSSHWTRDRGLWCVVLDDRYRTPTNDVLGGFVKEYGLRLHLAGTSKDP